MDGNILLSHPILDFKHGRRVGFTLDGSALEGFEGEPIAMALHAAGVRVYRETPHLHQPRGFFCAIGNCSSCFMVVDGIPNVRTCVTPLQEGMKVETQKGRGVIPMAPQQEGGHHA